jgi:hypothetical protein
MALGMVGAENFAKASLEKDRDEEGNHACERSKERGLIDGVGSHEVFDESVCEGIEGEACDHQNDSKHSPILKLSATCFHCHEKTPVKKI